METQENLSLPDDFDMILRPVGIIKNKIKKPFLTAGNQGITADEHDIKKIRERVHKSSQEMSEIIINENFIDLMDGIEKYSHLTILYWAHKVPEQSRSLAKVHPMGRKEIPQVGIFSTCSPARPNPVLMTVVRLHARKGNVLEVKGLDAVNESPVVDIKPYVRDFYPKENVLIPEWMQEIIKEMEE